jgi:hypothetical protein
MIGACPSSGPSGMLNDDSLFYTWMSGASGNTRVMIGAASSADLSIGQHYMISPDIASNVSQNFPIIAGYRKNTGVVWEENQSGVSTIKLAVSNTGVLGLPSDSIYLVSTNSNSFAKNPHVAFSNGVYHITWQDIRSRSIYYKNATIKNFVGINEVLKAENQIGVFPNPSDGIIHLDNLTNRNSIKVFNLTGQLVHERQINFEKTISIDLSDLPKGTYILEVRGVYFSEKQILMKN